MPSAVQHNYIPTLNGWRALSIIYVLLYHGTWIYFNPDTGLYPNDRLWLISKMGSFGVHFFFGISGYLITSRLIEEYNHNGSVSLTSFYWRRFFRIIPILLSYLGFILILKNFQLLSITTSEVLSSIFFYRNYIGEDGGWYTAHFWSLSMEEHYYLIWPTIFIFIIKFKRPWIPIIAILLLAIIWRMVEYRYHILTPHLPTKEMRSRTDLFFDYMMWGSLAAFLNILPRFKQCFFKITRDWMIYFSIALIHIVFFIKIPMSDAIKGILIQLCILLTVNYSKSKFSIFLENKYLSLIGIYSYSLYVWQQLVLTPANERIPSTSFLQSPPVNLLLLAGLAYLSFNYIENPSINYGKRFLKKLNLLREGSK